ncbi:DoxX family protein [Candidimonas sp. SYP-B2681]|uniref:DoxX family protein n=1 Tax=Candidimonas sp. SYP-B2681 TaxID=2497686 RepID=UPI000F87281B|nr:DoxX family protein [Candidimonas sp. SYP-B2681]RTZ45774.1 DoxX family protein [Candidimonas sp. SYP-B2681]
MTPSSAIWTPRILSILRIVSGYLLIAHGTTKILSIPATQMSGVPIASMYGASGLIELIFGALLVIGLFTQFAAFIASGFTAAAYFIGHVAPKGHLLSPLLNGGELAVLFCFVFLFIAFAGGGPWSVDALRKKSV